MNNLCTFSSDRKYRYTLLHRENPLFGGERFLMWIGLNPSIADEDRLDPTLTRIAEFSFREGYDGFIMTNLFGYIATDPKDMYAASDPIGADNDHWLLDCAGRCDRIVAAWGNHGSHLGRADKVMTLLKGYNLVCLARNADGSPRHPLYVAANTPFVPFC